ncbi:SDR family NAD(P)-dependent oxidoreductase [Bacteriovoracaceae bacterium]|nr:SDR family NAD(P)-dependent oxidoreductase [Bacteriovoracaceae bacterium]
MSKQVLITGVNGGIGSELAKQYLDLGRKVIGLDIGEDSHIKGESEEFYYFKIDLTKPMQVAKVQKAITEQFQVDVVIHNAGISQIDFFDQQSDEDFAQILHINLTSLVNSTRFWLKHFNQTEQRGTIVNISSVAGSVPTTKLVHYSTTKFAVTGFTQSLQLEKKECGWDTNILLVSPGFVKTPLMKIGEPGGFPKSLEYLVSEPKDCAEAIIKGIEKNELHIVPNAGAQALLGLRRVSPKITNFLQKWALKQK